MKPIITIILVLLSTAMFAGSAPAPGCADDLSLYNEIVGLVNDQDALREMNMKSLAEVTFTIGEDQTIHVEQVITKDNLLEFHIRQQLEGFKVKQCFDQGRIYTIRINANLI
jgi:hypothetical protein